MGAYEIFVGGLVLLVSVAMPALVFLRAAYRQHSRWLILAYTAAAALFGTYAQGLAPYSHDPQSLNADDWLTFLVGLVVFGIPGGGVYVLARALGKAKHHSAGLREQAAYFAIFSGLFGLGAVLSYLLGFSPFA